LEKKVIFLRIILALLCGYISFIGAQCVYAAREIQKTMLGMVSFGIGCLLIVTGLAAEFVIYRW
jgi:hypothetical protein